MKKIQILNDFTDLNLHVNEFSLRLLTNNRREINLEILLNKNKFFLFLGHIGALQTYKFFVYKVQMNCGNEKFQ